MCGRFTLDVTTTELKHVLNEQYQIEQLELDLNLPRYNVAPGQQIIAVLHDGKQFRAGMLKWGFIPFFAKDEKIGYKMINAKSETLAEKPSFRQSFQHKRCVILADGFYEWKKVDKEKIPMRFTLKNKHVFPLAGLWSAYTREDGSKLYTCTIITTSPNSLVEPVHSRMPVILTKENEKIWLDSSITNNELLESTLKPYNPDLMDVYQVSTLVNNTKNDTMECVQAIV